MYEFAPKQAGEEEMGEGALMEERDVTFSLIL